MYDNLSLNFDKYLFHTNFGSNVPIQGFFIHAKLICSGRKIVTVLQ